MATIIWKGQQFQNQWEKNKQNENILFKYALFAVATEAAMAIAKQNGLMTLAILLDMLMRSVFGEDEGFRKAKRQIRSRAVRQPSTRGGKGTKMSEALAER